MNPRPDDLCPHPAPLPPQPAPPHANPLVLASVWECASPAEADAMLAGTLPGYVYQRDGHPNAAVLADSCRRLHGAEEAVVTGTGMGALSAALLALVAHGEHVIVGSRVYGKTLSLFQKEGARLGIETTVVDTCDLAATQAAFRPNTKLVVAETIANPLLEVADLGALADLAHAHGALLLVDNTFATPVVCRPLDFGADIVMESLTKMMNGHSDAVLGLLCGRSSAWQRVAGVVSTWGLAAGPFACWLVSRGLMTLAVRMERACANARVAAEFLQTHPAVKQVFYPGLADHPHHALARRQFGGRQYGSIVAFELVGGRSAADAFIARGVIPFCPSLGELSTTLSHPETTSHRGLTPVDRAALGITGGTIRLSVGIESPEYVTELLRTGLQAAGS